MALSIFDPATGTNDPNIGQTIQTENPFMKLLGDRNFINLLAGIGGRLDPKGVGGALGGATIAYTGAQAAQERAASNANAQNQQTKMLLDALDKHGGLTPPGTPGVTSAAATDTGLNLKIDGNLEGQGGQNTITQTPLEQSPTPSTIAPSTIAPTQSSALSTEENKKKLRLFSHIFSALRG